MLHELRDKTIAVEEAVYVDVEHALPFVDRVVDHEGVLARDACRADENVDMAHLPDGRQSRAPDGARVRNVDLIRPGGGGADLGNRSLQTRGILVPYRDPPTLGGDPLRDAEPDAGRPARHHRRHPLKPFGVRHFEISCYRSQSFVSPETAFPRRPPEEPGR